MFYPLIFLSLLRVRAARVSPRAQALGQGLHEAECLLQAPLGISHQGIFRSHVQAAAHDIPTGRHDGPLWQRVLDVNNNKDGDMSILLLSLGLNTVAILGCVILFACLRQCFPMVYQNNAQPLIKGGLNTAPFIPSSSIFGWLLASWRVTPQQRAQCCGVDAMLLMEFSDLSMRLLALIGVPFLCILCPLHWFLGDGNVDRLSRIGMANTSMGSPLRWVHCAAVWYVVFATRNVVHRASEKFLAIRYDWLLGLEPPRSTTVLVQGIPEAFRGDHQLKAFFEMLFPNSVEAAYIVKKTHALRPLTAELKQAKLRLEEALFEWHMVDQAEGRRPQFYHGILGRIWLRCGGQNDRIDYYRDKVNSLEERAAQERERILRISKSRLPEEANLVNSDAGFVTFTAAREARLCLGMCLTGDREEFQVCVPPHPDDVVYSDLEVPRVTRMISGAFGYLVVVGIFLCFLPVMCKVGSLATSGLLLRRAPAFTRMLQGIISSAALTAVTAAVPAILMMVLNCFFVLGANVWGQLRLQTWLFWFSAIYVVLVTSLSGGLLGQVREIYLNPTAAPLMVAHSLPKFSHFYLNFVTMQWAVHGVSLVRCIPLAQYLVRRAFVGSARAAELAEPRDQDCYGIGFRSASWTIMLIIGIILSTVTPLVTLFCFVNFWIARTVCGYLVVFAETRKQDVGGHFFVTQLWHLQLGLIVYVVMMLGIMWEKYRSVPLVCVTGASLVQIFIGLYRFCWWRFQWEDLPFGTLSSKEALEGSRLDIQRYRSLGAHRPMYRQPELAPKARFRREATGSLEAFQERERLERRGQPVPGLAMQSAMRSALAQNRHLQNLPKLSGGDPTSILLGGVDFNILEKPMKLLEARDMSFPMPIAEALGEAESPGEEDGRDNDCDTVSWSPGTSQPDESSQSGEKPDTARERLQ